MAKIDKMQTMSAEPAKAAMRDYLSPGEVAAYAGLSYGTVKRAIDVGDIAAYRIGRRFFISRTDAEAFAAARRDVAAEGYSISEIMEKLCLSYAYVSRLIKSGELPSRRIGRKYFVTEKDFAEFMQSKRLDSRKTPAVRRK